MSDFLRVLVFALAAVNPALVAEVSSDWVHSTASRDRLRAAALAFAVGLGVCALAALFGGRVLDGLSISPESFRIAAGIVMAPFGLVAMIRRWPMAEEINPGWKAAIAPFGLGLLAGPPSIAAAVVYANDEGKLITIAALAIAMLPAIGHLAVTKMHSTRWVDWAARCLGAVLLVEAVNLVIRGIQAV